jgi:hypothetical protein
MIFACRNPASRFLRDFFLSGPRSRAGMRRDRVSARLSRISATPAAVDKPNSVKYQTNISTTSCTAKHPMPLSTQQAVLVEISQ